jgi:hypothetical protein
MRFSVSPTASLTAFIAVNSDSWVMVMKLIESSFKGAKVVILGRRRKPGARINRASACCFKNKTRHLGGGGFWTGSLVKILFLRGGSIGKLMEQIYVAQAGTRVNRSS